MEKKNKAWKAITQQYEINAMKNGITIPRTNAQLKRCWTNLKCRKADSANKQYQLQTGGGPPAKINEDEDLNETVRSIVPTIDFTLDLENPWDSTAEFESIACSEDEIFVNDSCEVESMEMNEDYGQYEYCEDFGKNDDQVPCSSISTKSANNYVQPNKHLSISSVENAARKISTDTNFTKKPLSQFNISAVSEIRLQKLEEAIQQQAELHQKKLHAITVEKEYWEEMKNTVALKKSVYVLEIKAMKAQLKYWEEKQN
ncbi:myb/SANT-like DNA-binding domain-containing protein 3 [Monomorium pharaonis]|uniref:myb/SANT-like DNA-binding domain-containing protein 3 n=1 Tax=Monomorium pharaonis TaxID=307658 RepID=UPI0017468B5B|nr:myb/SANT-like DNA-binding domain-containing protein 3 [Monomorium pharaonis]